MQRSLVVLLLVAPTLLAEPPRKDDVIMDDHELVQGVWKVKKMVFGGNEMPAGEMAGLALEFKGDKATPREKNQNREKPADFKLDPTKSPKRITIKADKEEMVGIYELNGDTFKLCLSHDNKKVPTKFESPQGSEVILIIMEREKK